MLLSSDVALQIGQQQAMFGQQQQHADIISDAMRRSHDPQYGSPLLAGKAFNAIGAVGAPLGGLALGMMGMDPMSLGMKAFGGARGLGMGFAAAGGLGLATFGLGTAAMAGVGYVGGQLQAGAQQQQQFMMGMQRSFNFMTSQGQGFNNHQLGVMGGGLRQMSGQIGPQGQMVGFEELSHLAQNMGKMGMTSGTQDVASFTQNFKKMLQTVKHIATELGGSLQEAQQTMAGLRNSGVFKGNDQMKIASEIRNFSVGGGLSTGELSQAANFGSQVSRAIGGRGGAGAFAGIRTLGSVGVAVASGVLSDEDIYNATGLRGNEGKQAFASAQLQGAAAWLKGGRGRRFVASLAGSNGTLDAQSIMDWQNGGMGTGRTMENAHRNLNGVGRADFIRNEGRLRGEALAAFGGNLPAMALQQWAESKGIDIHNMDDRNMIFAQRQLGMDRDMVSNAVKMLDGMPEMLRHQKWSARNDALKTEMAQHSRTSGVEGAKRKLEEAREHVQNKLQGTGQQLYTDMVNHIDSWLQETSGRIARQASEEIDRTYEGLRKGQGGNMASTLFGTGPSKRVASAQGSSRTTKFDNSGMTLELFNKGSLFGVSMNDKMKKAGYDLSGAGSDKELQGALANAQDFYRGSQIGGNEDVRKMGAGASSLIQRLYAEGVGEKKGAARQSALVESLTKEAMGGNKQARELLAQLTKEGTSRGQGNNLASLEAGAGIAEEQRIGANAALPAGAGSLSGGIGESERVRRLGGGGKSYSDAVLGQLGKIAGYEEGKGLLGNLTGMGKTLGVKTGLALATGGASAISELGYGLYKGLTGTADANRAADAEGQHRISYAGMKETETILSGEDASASLEKRMRGLDKGSAQYKNLQKLKELNKLTMREKAGEVVDYGNLQGLKNDLVAGQEEQMAINRRSAARAAAYDAEKELGSLGRVGLVDSSGVLKGGMLDKMKLNASQRGSLQAHLDLLNHERKGGSERADFDMTQALGGSDFSKMLDLSVADMRSMGASLQREGALGLGGMYMRQAAEKQKVVRQMGQGGRGYAAALGIKLDHNEMRALAGMKAGDQKLTTALAEKLGITEGGSKEDLAALSREKEQLEVRRQTGGISESEYQDTMNDLAKKKSTMEGDAHLMEKLKELNAPGLSAEDRYKKLEELKADPEYQKKSEEKRKQQENQDPSTRHLSKIAEASETMKKALLDLPDRLGTVMKQNPQPQG